MGGRRWTPAEDALVVDWVESRVHLSGLVPILNRTYAGIRDRWYQALRPRYGDLPDMNAHQVARLFGVPHHWRIVLWFKAGWIDAKPGRRRRGSGPEWAVTPDALRAFIENPEHWSVWEPARITDPFWRSYAEGVRRGGPRFLSVPEAARVLYVAPCTVRHWVHKGRLRAYPAPDARAWCLREDEVEACLKQLREAA